MGRLLLLSSPASSCISQGSVPLLGTHLFQAGIGCLRWGEQLLWAPDNISLSASLMALICGLELETNNELLKIMERKNGCHCVLENTTNLITRCITYLVEHGCLVVTGQTGNPRVQQLPPTQAVNSHSKVTSSKDIEGKTISSGSCTSD